MNSIGKDIDLSRLESDLVFKRGELKMYERFLKEDKKDCIIMSFAGSLTLLSTVILMNSGGVDTLNVVAICMLVVALNNIVMDYKSRKGDYKSKMFRIDIEVKQLERAIEKLKGE